MEKEKIGFSQQTSSTRVTFDDIRMLISAGKTETRATVTDSYEFIIDEDNDTLFYVVNHAEGGWTMYASDKRVPAIVAEDTKGKFSKDEAALIMGDWLETMADDMKAVRHATDDNLGLTKDEIEANMSSWEAVCDPNSFIMKQKSKTRAYVPFPTDFPGQYKLYKTESEAITYDSVPHLTSTAWSQGSPYNMYCPNKTEVGDDGETKAPAGCVAIAGAQMLYFLHYKIGIPEFIPDTAYCYGNIKSYTWGQMDRERNIWSLIHHSGNSGYRTYDFWGNNVQEASLVAPLIANVAFLVDMDFGNAASGAQTEDLVNKVFGFYGISCQYTTFNENTLRTSLLSGMPVIARAYATKKKKLFKTVYKDGHAFIIDGYKRTQVKTTYHYKWVYDGIGEDGLLPPAPDKPDSVSVSISSPYISYVRMNWGWGWGYYDGFYNNAWCTPTGAWKANENTPNYQYKRYMISGFKPKEE